MLTTLRSVVLAAVLAPAVLFLPPLPQSADGAETVSQAAPAALIVQATSCEQAVWPYKAACADQSATTGSPQVRLISVDRVAPIAGR